MCDVILLFFYIKNVKIYRKVEEWYREHLNTFHLDSQLLINILPHLLCPLYLQM